MTSTNTGDGSATCAFPGCERRVRDRAGDGGGKPPIYCDLVNQAGKFAHTPLTAARERTRRERQGATGQSAALAGEAPASAARDRAATLLDQFRAAAEQMTGTLAAAIEAMTSAGDPESVSAELTAARRQVDRTQLEADERVQAAEAARDQATADAAAARQAATDATRRAEEAREELRQTRTDHRDELAALRRDHRDELAAERQRADATLDAMRTEHRRETEALQAALTALGTTQHEQPAPQHPRASRRTGKEDR